MAFGRRKLSLSGILYFQGGPGVPLVLQMYVLARYGIFWRFSYCHVFFSTFSLTLLAISISLRVSLRFWFFFTAFVKFVLNFFHVFWEAIFYDHKWPRCGPYVCWTGRCLETLVNFTQPSLVGTPGWFAHISVPWNTLAIGQQGGISCSFYCTVWGFIPQFLHHHRTFPANV